MKSGQKCAATTRPIKPPSQKENGVGVKLDEGKAKVSLIPRVAIEAEAMAMAFGAEKYGKNNWRHGIAYSRLLDAALRHILQYADGEDNDSETGISHLAHARCSLAMLMATPKGWDDRKQGIDTEPEV